MVSQGFPGLRLALGLLVVSGALAGCSLLHRDREQPPPPPPPVASDSGAISADELTATEAAVSGSDAAASAPAATAPAAVPPAPDASIVNPNAPKSYTVKRGDTLWGIASLFLRDPWLWPEVWYVNPQVENPHLIYPGDTLVLGYGANGRPEIRLAQEGPARVGARVQPRLHSSAEDAAIPTIPYSAISAFLSRPTVLSSDQLRNAPYIVAFPDKHQAAGSGLEAYISHLKDGEHARFTVVHLAGKLRDPDDGKILGYQGIYTATALVAAPGNPTKALLIDTARETLRGDKVVPSDNDVPLNFALRAPQGDLHGRIISVVDGTNVIGQYQIVAINRGRHHGLDVGNVLAIDRKGEVVRDIYGHGGVVGRLGGLGRSLAPRVQLPGERTGTLLVFKVFDRMSYGLVVGASNTIQTGDAVRTP